MKIPDVILATASYRKEVAKDVVEHYEEVVDSEEEYEESEEGTVTLALDKQVSGVRGRTNYALLELYNQKGYDVFKETCMRMKGNNWFNKEEYSTFKGECAEVYLYVTVLEFIKKYELPWKAYLSLVIPHRSGEAGQTTELDLVLVSEEMITVFEAKSYGGDKKIKDVCTISRKGGNTDIYRQNALHCESLIKQIADYNINDQRGMKSVLFSYAEGSLTDVRDAKYKKLMPVVTEDNLLKYLTQLTKLSSKFWKASIFEKVDGLSNALTMEDHMKHINSKK